MFSDSIDVLVTDLTDVQINEDLLSGPELGRAVCCASPALRDQYLAAHSWLRRRLADYLGFPAAEIEFARGEHGKPSIANPVTDLSFNLAYSGGHAVLAVGFRSDIGVDIESVEGAEINPDMLHGVFRRPETESVLAAPDRVREFLQLRVRKEALAKASGLSVEETAAASDMRGSSPIISRGIEVTDLSLGSGLICAVAAPPGSRLDLSIVIEESARTEWPLLEALSA
ncbi:MAG: hypothetical protein U9N84_08465 [Actinomycetota bacterium]|nr:hypothetical protein [Actinomycetota bacterium]